MSYQVFDNGDDEKYFRWMERHLDGFILNVERVSKSLPVVLHCSNCGHIRRGLAEGAFTGRDQIKIAAFMVDELIRWRNKYRPDATVKYCSDCKPPKSVLEQFLFYPDELDSQVELDSRAELWEGAKVQVLVNQYERNAQARQRCIAHYGTSCLVCELDFVERYGPIGEGFIHVHHIKPLASINAGYQVDPINDLRPVCPNCHAMLHRGKEQPLTIEELRALLNC